MMYSDMEITRECATVHEYNVKKGFWAHAEITFRDPLTGDVEGRVPNPSIFPEKMMLITSEVSEMMDAFRDCPEGSPEEAAEAADVLIRLMDYCAARRIDLGAEYLAKMAKNEGRPYLHG